MFTFEQLEAVKNNPEYEVLILNCHDIRIRSLMTGHEWVVISNYGPGSCRILHRHNSRVPFHTQRGRYRDLNGAMAYIEIHDTWYSSNR